MRVSDLGLGPTIQGLNTDSSFPSTNRHRIQFFNFITLCQFYSQKLNIFSFFANFYLLIQNIYVSFWPYLDLTKKDINQKFDYIRTPIPFEENMTNAFFFYTTDEETRKSTIISFILLCISYVFFFISLVSFCSFFFKGIVNFHLLFCYKFFVRFICPVMTVPIGFQSGWLIYRVQSMKLYDEDGIEIFIALIVLDMILYSIIIFFTIVSNIFNSKSIIIVEYLSYPNNGFFQSYLALFPSITLFLSNVLPLFYEKLRYFVIALHMAFCISVVIWSFWFPYGKVKYNGFVSAVALSMLVSDIYCFTKMNRKWYRYFIFLGCFFVFFIIMNLLIKLRLKILLKIKKNNQENKEESAEFDDRSDTANYQIFGDPNLNQYDFENLSISKALFILRVAIATQNEIFLNGKLVELLASRVESDEEKIQLSFLICYFPEFQSIFFAILTGLKRARFLPILSEFQLFQLRTYDTCSHSDTKINGIDKVIHETSVLEAYIRSFWQVIDSECSIQEENDDNKEKKIKLKSNLFSQFDCLSRTVINCKNKWKSIIGLYPNNVEAASEYTKFLIYRGDFIGANEWKTVSRLLYEGKIFKVNPAQVSFLRTFPNYFKHVVPKASLIKGFDDIELQSKIENVEDLIEMPEARFEFQRSTNSSYPFSIFVFMFISVISLLFIAIFWIYGIFNFAHFDHYIDRLSFLLSVSYLSQQISINLMLGIMVYDQLPDVDIFPTPEEIFNCIFSNGYNDRVGAIYSPSLIQLDGDYKDQLYNSIKIAVETIDHLRNSELEQIENSYNIQVVMDVLYNHSIINTYYNTKNEYVNSTEGVQSLLFSHLGYFYTLTFEDNYDYVNDSFYYHAVSAGDIVLNIIDLASESIIKTNDDVYNQNEFFYSTGILILTAIYCIVSIIFIWIDFYFIYRNFKSIANTLCYFPKTVRQKAASPFINDEYISISSSSIKSVQPKVKNSVVVTLFIDTFINLLLCGAIIYFYFVDDVFKLNFVKITELSHYYSLETSKEVEVVFLLMAAYSYGRIVPSVDSKYKSRLTQSVAKFIEIHQQCWNYSVEGDCGIKGEYLQAINDLKNLEKCPDWPDKTYHELIACLAEEPAVNAFIDFTKSLIGKLNHPSLFKTDEFKYFIHFSLTHLYYDIQNFAYILSMGADVKKEDFVNVIKIIGSISIIVAFLLFILKIYIFMSIRNIFKTLFAFTSRVLPSDLIENSHLMHSLLGIKNHNKTLIEDSDISFLVQESSTPIVFLDRSMLIEFINDSFSRKFGYDANFIVGQPISTIIEDESTLFYIDSMKFFETTKCEVKTIMCKKGKGNKTLFDITFIPIHKNKNKHISESNKEKEVTQNDDDDNDENDKKTFINCIALVFVEKTAELSLQKKCNSLKSTTIKISQLIYPESFKLFIDGHLKMCAICIIKISNAFAKNISPNRILIQRQNLYDMLHEKLEIFPLLIPIDSKNGFFMVVGCKKDDPVELAVECLNFAFSVVNSFSSDSPNHSYGLKFTGPLFAVVETGGELFVGWSGSKEKKIFLEGELINRALKVLDNASLCGSICVSKKTYDYLMQNDYLFVEKEIPEEICGEKYIYSVESNDDIYGPTKLSKNGSLYESNATGFSSSFIEELKEEEYDD